MYNFPESVRAWDLLHTYEAPGRPRFRVEDKIEVDIKVEVKVEVKFEVGLRSKTRMLSTRSSNSHVF